MAVWDETWTWKTPWSECVTPNSRAAGHSGAVLFPDGGRMVISYDPAHYSILEGAARGRLAAAAPEIARLLLSRIDNSDSGKDDVDWYCFACHLGGRHAPDCRLVAVLRRAGVIS